MGRDARLNPHSLSTGIVLDPVVVDRLNRSVGCGDVVLVTGIPLDLLWTVEDVQPVVDPRAPSNLVRVRLKTEFSLTVRARQAVRELLLIVDDDVEPMPPPPVPIAADPPSLRAWARYMVAKFRSERG